MAILDFPSSPSVGTIYPSPAVTGQPQYTYDGEKWTSGASTGAIYIADSPPAAPVGSLWYESDTGMLYVRYNDGSSTQWVAVPGGASDAVRYGVQTLTTAEATQARKNVYAAPMDALAYSGMQLNGSMDIGQELGGAARTTGGYICDGWRLGFGGSMVLSVNQGGGGMFAANGFPNLIYSSVTTAQPSLGAGDYTQIFNRIEGYRIARLAWGTANAQPITIGFWTSHFRTGVYGGVVRNLLSDRSYAFTYTQAASNVPQYNVVTVPGCTTGVWEIGNTTGMDIGFSMGCGTTYTAPSNNTWLNNNYIAAQGQINAVAATSDVFRLTGVVVLPGIEAPSAARSPLIMRPYDQELLTCQRYYRQLAGSGDVVGWAQAYATTGAQAVCFFNEMRATPTLSMSGNFTLTAANSSSLTVTGYTAVAACSTSVAANITVGSGLVAGNVTKLSLADGNARFKIDARL